MRGITIGKVITFLILCIVVGWLLSVFGVTPEGFWRGTVNVVRSVATAFVNLLEGSWGYLLAGAAIVLPIYIIMLLYRRMKRR